MGKQIFRKSALEKLSSPERLDALMQVTRPTGWFALVAVFAIMGLILLWSVYGRIPTKVEGRGLLLSRGGLVTVVSPHGGVVSAIEVSVGDTLTSGQRVLRIERPDLSTEVTNARGRVSEARDKLDALRRFHEEDSTRFARARASREASLRKEIENLEKEMAEIAAVVEREEQLVKEKVIARTEISDRRDDLSDAQAKIDDRLDEIKRLEREAYERENGQAREQLDARQRLAEAQRRLAEAQARHDRETRVVAGVSGRVVDLPLTVGDALTVGQMILSVEPSNRELEALAYVGLADGKRVQRGMPISVSPSTVRRERYGSIRGRVRYVSDFPQTRGDMMRQLGGNAVLVDSLLKEGALILVRVDLIEDDSTPSGYRWTSSRGPRERVHSGTLCAAEVTVSQERPLALALPIMRRELGL